MGSRRRVRVGVNASVRGFAGVVPRCCRQLLRCPGQGHHLHRGIRGGYLPDQKFSALLQADQPDPFAGKDLFQGRGDHAAIPGAPVDADGAAAGSAARFGLGKLVENFVGNGVINLSGTAETAGGGCRTGR